MDIEKAPFGRTPAGQTVEIFTLRNSYGTTAKIMTYGGILISLEVPDRSGVLGDVVLGYDNLKGYIDNNPYFGCIVGRYCNRIAGGRFMLDGVEYRLAVNNGPNHLHGGLKGFDKVVWKAEPIQSRDSWQVVLTYLSSDGQEGYPGNLRCKVTYSLTEKNELRIDYAGQTDKTTHVNLTHHSYFNLAGQGRGDILGHELMINADRFTPVDANLIPTGEYSLVAETVMDFTKAVPLGRGIDSDYEQIRYGNGYDHNWVLNKKGDELSMAAEVYEPMSGRVMELFTTQPAVQVYTGNFLDGSITGKEGKVYNQRYGLCLETQHFPDTPNKPQFPSTVLRPGQKYMQTTVYRFSAR